LAQSWAPRYFFAALPLSVRYAWNLVARVEKIFRRREQAESLKRDLSQFDGGDMT
jgi:hypothetical protein